MSWTGEGKAEKGGKGTRLPSVWRSVLLGARATVSAKAAAGNLLSTGEDPSFELFSLSRLAIRQVSRSSHLSFHFILLAAILAIPISFSNLNAFSRIFTGRARTSGAWPPNAAGTLRPAYRDRVRVRVCVRKRTRVSRDTRTDHRRCLAMKDTEDIMIMIIMMKILD